MANDGFMKGGLVTALGTWLKQTFAYKSHTHAGSEITSKVDSAVSADSAAYATSALSATSAQTANRAAIASSATSADYAEKIGVSSSSHPAIGSTNTPIYINDAGSPTPCTAVMSHTHAASVITSGTFATARIPSLDASKITSGTFATARIPTNISITGNAATADFAQSADSVEWGNVDNKTSVEVSFTSGGTTYTYNLVTK